MRTSSNWTTYICILELVSIVSINCFLNYVKNVITLFVEIRNIHYREPTL